MKHFNAMVAGVLVETTSEEYEPYAKVQLLIRADDPDVLGFLATHVGDPDSLAGFLSDPKKSQTRRHLTFTVEELNP